VGCLAADARRAWPRDFGHRPPSRVGSDLVSVKHISAVAFAVRHMAEAVEFYEKCGFVVIYGGAGAPFTSLQSGEAYVNLIATPDHQRKWWGRAIFRVTSADEQFSRLAAAGLRPDAPPQDASWGERYFHITDPDGHELSFAELLPPAGRK
jgi:catechol 2,3-dioxygenase-like lactoylglutathione lyase family enzyme